MGKQNGKIPLNGLSLYVVRDRPGPDSLYGLMGDKGSILGVRLSGKEPQSTDQSSLRRALIALTMFAIQAFMRRRLPGPLFSWELLGQLRFLHGPCQMQYRVQ